MNYIVLDLEWNQSPAGKSGEIPGFPFEIIEIGAIRMDERRRMLGHFYEVVRPKVYKKLHHHTRQVVHLKQEDLEQARSFPEVAADFIAWCGEDPLFCTWGPADLLELQRNFSWHKLKSPFSYPLFYYDIQKIYAIAFEERHDRRALEYAVDSLDLSRKVPFHSALSDAWYTSLVMKYLTNDQILENSSIDYYHIPQNRSQEVSWHYPTYTKFISRPFFSKRQALRDKIVSTVSCPYCGSRTVSEIPWFPAGGRNCLCLSSCPTHGRLKGKIRFRHTPDEHYYVIRTIRSVKEEEAVQIKDLWTAYSRKHKFAKP